MRWTAVLAFGLTACSQGTDVVARALVDAGTLPAEGATKPSLVAPAEACERAAGTFAVLTKVGGIQRFALGLKMLPPDSSPVKCVSPSSPAIAVDRDGHSWVTSDGRLSVVDPSAGACKTLEVALSPTAMAFVQAEGGEREMLYALVDGVLIVVDPSTFARTPIGKLALEDVRGFAGTSDGRLIAFAGDPVVTIAYVSLGDASLKMAWQVKSPTPIGGRFVGGLVTENGFDLLFGTDLYTYVPMKGVVALRGSIFGDDPGIIGVAAAACIVGPK